MRIFKKRVELNWRYIFGETLLIVLGILIALFLNNLNEKRKLRIFEENITEEVKKSLVRDNDQHIVDRIKRGNQIINSSEIILEYLNGDLLYHDSLESHFWRMNWIMIFEPQTIPFERLKVKGIEIVSNEESRLKLLELYDFTYPKVKYLVEDYNQWTAQKIEPFCLKNFAFKTLSRGKGYQPIDSTSLLASVEYKNLVIEKRSRTKGVINQFELAKNKVNEMLEILEKQ